MPVHITYNLRPTGHICDGHNSPYSKFFGPVLQPGFHASPYSTILEASLNGDTSGAQNNQCRDNLPISMRRRGNVLVADGRL
jgi:hypothetical protein